MTTLQNCLRHGYPSKERNEAADRIDALEAERDALRATLRGVLADAQAQDVLFEWWAVIGHFLDPDDPLRTRKVEAQND